MSRSRSSRSVEIPGLNHGKAPIPAGARVGNVIYSSGLAGKDRRTNMVAPGVELQARLAFENLEIFVKAAGAALEDVVRVTVYIKDETVRSAINVEWLRYFPDPSDRPARHILVHDLPGEMLLQLEVVAVAQE